MGWRSLLDNSEIRSSNLEKSIYWDRYKILPLEAYLFWDSSLGPKLNRTLVSPRPGGICLDFILKTI